jgi:hypothetical protein
MHIDRGKFAGKTRPMCITLLAGRSGDVAGDKVFKTLSTAGRSTGIWYRRRAIDRSL